MASIVTRKAVTFINNQTPATITESTLDLDKCYNENEIVIEVHAAALNPVDFLLHEFSNPRLSTKNPKGYSRDYSGIIVRKGAKVAPIWDIGDHVNGMFSHVYGEQGTLTNYLILDPVKQSSISHIVQNSSAAIDVGKKVPDEIEDRSGTKRDDFVKNAAWPLVFGTAYSCLMEQGQVWDKDSRILVLGASTAVSNCLVQIAKNQLHVGTVVGICSSKSLTYNKEIGFDYTVAYDQGDGFIANLRELMKTPEFVGKKFDLICDSVGTSEFFPVIQEFLKPRNENSYYVTVSGNEKYDYKNPTLGNFVTISGPVRRFNPWRTFNYKGIIVSPNQAYMDLGNRMITLGRFAPRIDSVYKFEEFQEAIDRLRSNRAKGKVVITIKE
ncbi:uncharacterized protein NDAI_0H03100 [Naumovozyma dairenensis CBS 421]|uniref:Enoyl reductase (ER) domain-containing protein n=1 Tax=Naumovozyma dairenensis (strain ATCC 10597 / BCRC 20456 / CBS 421 / NBRC 0211 / NRRL Y-12639) TaxID=1071378 RepID=G0WFC2_NAUDC|nr:hypothetical protein NDAI_0H03100 [Naumovozyma dairenensis CBS 421]CCD26483.1 hypothetical protein NDAI_0H03100 [Naumovozyma dairenensis CBS 421]